MSRWETTGFLSGSGCGEALICHYRAGSGGAKGWNVADPLCIVKQKHTFNGDAIRNVYNQSLVLQNELNISHYNCPYE